MGRIQFIELHEQPWLPSHLRDDITDALQFGLNVFKAYAPAAPLLRNALHSAQSRSIVDLCSGGGGPWLELSQWLHADARAPVQIVLTDKYPNIRAYQDAGAASGNYIGYCPSPVDAMNVPPELKGFRTMFTSLHHFPPEQARAVLQNRRRRRPWHRHFRSNQASSANYRTYVSLGSHTVRVYAIDPSVSLVAVALDVCDPDRPIRALVRRSCFLPPYISAAGVARDHRKIGRKRIRMASGRAFKCPRWSASRIPNLLPTAAGVT